MTPAVIPVCCSSSFLFPSRLSSRFPSQKLPTLPQRRARAAPAAVVSSLRLGPLGVEDLAELVQNKVLVATAIAGAIGQLSKPLTSAINGKGIDLRAAVRSGGMPSTHSAAVAAAATSLGLERGFADSIFGMSAVFAALVMYDSQGVRREVGLHAKVLNKIQGSDEVGTKNSKLQSSSINCDKVSPLVSISEKADSYGSNQESYSAGRPEITSTKVDLTSQVVDAKEPLLINYSNYNPLNESVGHTEVQVIVGAILGFIVSLAIESIL
ncbi:hypothetical protein Cni_G02539 [Canna indica]|uniref:Membrane protein YuiD n=1 Tax=Canna indica TaxID=4628 RepID=A0AAQ3JR35_9LILI|nr:hypothetical protein Cni_G02539 [Canna indica]